MKLFLQKISLNLHSCRKMSSQASDLFKIRNIGISAHIDSGKTTLTERVLFYTGRVSTMHEVKGKDGVGAVMDFMELERQRGITIQSAATYTKWKNCNINIIDTPGHVDFTVEVERALRVLDGAILVLCAVGGVQSQTFTVNRQMDRYEVPRIAFINKLDRLGAEPSRVLSQLRSKLNWNCAYLYLPLGLEAKNTGIIDVIRRKNVYFDEPSGLNIREEPVSSALEETVETRRKELIETVANVDDKFGEIFLADSCVPEDELRQAIRRSCIARKFVPIYVGTALKNRGVQPLLDGVVEFLPNPGEVANYALTESNEKKALNPARSVDLPLVALAFKLEAAPIGQLTYLRLYQGCLAKGSTICNTRTKKKTKVAKMGQMSAQTLIERERLFAGDIGAIFGIDCASGDTFVHENASEHLSMEPIHVPEAVLSMSIKPAGRFSDNFLKSLKRFTREDPTFRMKQDVEMEEFIISGMGELQLEVYAQRMEKEYNCPCILGKPKVAFRETLIAPVEFDYLHKKQSGGAGQFGKVSGVVEPLPAHENTQLIFSDETVGADLPKHYVPSIEKGFRLACEKGCLSGNKLMGIRYRLKAGLSHVVDSSDFSFQQAAIGSMRQVMEFGYWTILEPIMKVEVSSSSEFQGSIMSLLTRRNGTVVDTQLFGENATILAMVPLNDMFGFVGELRSHTQGKGEYTMEYECYRTARQDVVCSLSDEYQKEQEKQSVQSSTKKAKKKNK